MAETASRPDIPPSEAPRGESRKAFLKQCAAAAFAARAAGLPMVLAREAGEARPGAGAPPFEPPYLRLQADGELRKRGGQLRERMRACNLCPRECGARRLDGEKGDRGAGPELVVSGYHAHFGEERPLVGRGGSGTVFFSHCNLRCVFCINWQTSQGRQGERETVETLAQMMLNLQRRGCHNIKHRHADALLVVRPAGARQGRGLRLPLVYNTSGWERADVLPLLDGVVDIYLPDFKYSDSRMAGEYSPGAESYPAVTQAALLEMHRQVSVAKPAADGLMYRGLMIRHLVMPNGVSGSRQVFGWIAANLPKDTYVNVMSQYRPVFQASRYPAIARPLTRGEFSQAVGWAREAGLTNNQSGTEFRSAMGLSA